MAPRESNDGLFRVVVIVLGILVLFPVLMMVFAMPMMWMMLVWLVVLLGIGYLLYRGLVGGRRTVAVGLPAETYHGCSNACKRQFEEMPGEFEGIDPVASGRPPADTTTTDL